MQYGTIVSNVTLQFGGWAPTGTQSNVQLQLSVANANAVISFPTEVVNANNNFGVTTLENYAVAANVATVTIPAGVSQLDYNLSSLDCGNTITIEQYNRPRKATQIAIRTPANIGQQGDRAGTTCVDSTYLYVCTADYDGTTAIWKRVQLQSY